MRLEKFRREDEHLYSLLVTDPEVMGMNMGRVFTDEEASAVFRAMLLVNDRGNCPGFCKVISEGGGGDVFIGLGAVVPDAEQGAAEIEYMLLPQYWNMGFGTELAGMLVESARMSGIYSELTAVTDPGNIPSKKVLLRNGFAFVKSFVNEEGEPADLYRRQI